MGLFFSIIIPTYNRKTQLQECINSLKLLQFPLNAFEVIIVDDGSNDGTKIYLDSIHTSNFGRFTNPGKGPAIARNLGAKAALGEYLIFLDDDCTVDAQWLNKFKTSLDSSNYTVIGGRAINKSSSSISQVMEFMTSYYQLELNTDDNTLFLTSNNLLCKKEDFLKVGGFDESFPYAGAEDRDLIRRFNADSINVQYDNNIFVFHHHRLNLKELFRQQFNYGKGSYIFYNKYINYENRLDFSNTLLLHFSMIKDVFSKKGLLRGFFYSVVIVLSQLFVTSGYLYQKYSKPQISGKS